MGKKAHRADTEEELITAFQAFDKVRPVEFSYSYKEYVLASHIIFPLVRMARDPSPRWSSDTFLLI